MLLLNLKLPHRSSLFPYTTLFRSSPSAHHRSPMADHQAPRRPRQSPSISCYHTSSFRGMGDSSRNSDNNNGCDGKDRKSTRLNSSHVEISYAVFFLKKTKSLLRRL